MKRLLYALIFALWWLVLLIPCRGQSVGAGMVAHGGMGFSPLAPAILGAWDPGPLHTRGWWSSADKYVGRGWTSLASACVAWRGVGPALMVRHTETAWRKTSIYPGACARWGGLEGQIHLRDPWTENHGRGGTLACTTPLTRRLRCHASLTILRFTIPPAYGLILTTGVLVGGNHDP